SPSVAVERPRVRIGVRKPGLVQIGERVVESTKREVKARKRVYGGRTLGGDLLHTVPVGRLEIRRTIEVDKAERLHDPVGREGVAPGVPREPTGQPVHPSGQEVVPGLAVQGIHSRPAVELIVARTSDQEVVSPFTLEKTGDTQAHDPRAIDGVVSFST